ncbi:hypothetical protein DFP72DRAFT_861599 [Ephemerocybe angulata]|uniref:Uncharacterized protein n=1 Tax=Ephemerocybe angulata TaxID=980116 RepID=A0A8H6LUX1_9AGAR|nr:hypothetical protein DFP72DRAFT_861599 [Tulosesus angulatus]
MYTLHETVSRYALKERGSIERAWLLGPMNQTAAATDARMDTTAELREGGTMIPKSTRPISHHPPLVLSLERAGFRTRVASISSIGARLENGWNLGERSSGASAHVDSAHPLTCSLLARSLVIWSGGEREDRVRLVLATCSGYSSALRRIQGSFIGFRKPGISLAASRNFAVSLYGSSGLVTGLCSVRLGTHIALVAVEVLAVVWGAIEGLENESEKGRLRESLRGPDFEKEGVEESMRGGRGKDIDGKLVPGGTGRARRGARRPCQAGATPDLDDSV